MSFYPFLHRISSNNLGKTGAVNPCNPLLLHFPAFSMTLVEKIRQNNARWKIFLKCNFQFLGGSPCIEYCKYEKEENTNVINFAGYSKCVWCGVNQMIIHFSEASILPSVCSSICPFLQIILQLNLKCGMKLNEFWPPYSSDDLCLLFCLFLLQWWAFYFTLIDRAREWIVCPICQLQRVSHLWANLLKQLVTKIKILESVL